MSGSPITRAGLAAAGLVIAALGLVAAQAPTVKRTVLQQADLSIPGREVVTARAELPPAGTTGRHTHPGEEVSYVVSGTVTVFEAGKPDRVLKAGDAFIIPAGAVHGATNASSGDAVIIANYIVEKGKPLTTPAP